MKTTVVTGNKHGLTDCVLFHTGPNEDDCITLSFGIPSRPNGEKVTVITGSDDNTKWFDFPNVVSAMAFVIAELYNVKG